MVVTEKKETNAFHNRSKNVAISNEIWAPDDRACGTRLMLILLCISNIKHI